MNSDVVQKKVEKIEELNTLLDWFLQKYGEEAE